MDNNEMHRLAADKLAEYMKECDVTDNKECMHAVSAMASCALQIIAQMEGSEAVIRVGMGLMAELCSPRYIAAIATAKAMDKSNTKKPDHLQTFEFKVPGEENG
jgi:hypothetical protein